MGVHFALARVHFLPVGPAVRPPASSLPLVDPTRDVLLMADRIALCVGQRTKRLGQEHADLSQSLPLSLSSSVFVRTHEDQMDWMQVSKAKLAS